MEETILVECSRQSSIEGTTQNFTSPAEWTCETGDGIVLDIGDKIQMHSGFVSEKGAEAGKIEIKERERLPVKVEVSKEIQFSHPQEPANVDQMTPLNGVSAVNQNQIYPFACEFGGTEIRTIPYNDGETNVIFSPYKTTNGEFYAGLPRRHIGYNASINAVSPTNIWDVYDYSGRESNGTTRTANNGVVGNVQFAMSGPMSASLSGGSSPAPEDNVVFQFPPADRKLVWKNKDNPTDRGGNPVPNGPKCMILNDCSRYTIFRMKEVFRTLASANASGADGELSGLGGPDSVTASASGTEAYQDRVDRRDPAILGDWEQVKELFTMKSKAGFNSPLDVATEITEQLNKRGELKNASAYTRPYRVNAEYPMSMRLLGSYSSPTRKPYNCASMLWDHKLWDNFRDVRTGASNEVKEGAHLYMSMYQHIGVKRPDLWRQGRSTNASQGFLKPDVSNGGGDSPIISQCLNLGMRWTEDNLLNLDKLFKIQGKYPELFRTDIRQMGNPGLAQGTPNYNLQGVDYHRYIHINRQDENDGAESHFPSFTLGYDLYGPREGHAIPAGYSYNQKMASYPLFFDYNKNTENLNFADAGFCEDSNGGFSDINDLAYGWARKMRISRNISVSGEDEFYIGIQFTRTGNRIPSYLFNGKSHIAQTGKGGRRWGFDYHFSAYGSACINLYSGIVPRAHKSQNSFDIGGIYKPGITCGLHFQNLLYENSQATQANAQENFAGGYNTGAYYRSLFLGADNPALAFDATGNRFSFTNLHTAERGSNIHNAGQLDVRNASGVITVPGATANPQADSPCYKVNKALLGNSYCPDMAPYNDLIIPADREMPQQLMLSNNFEAWQPYDATCGLFIEQIVVPEAVWNENLIGVLGFYYSQFDNTDTTRQATINTRADSSNLASLTTQAPIRASDMLSWTKNGFGNSNFSLTEPMMYTRRYTSFGGSVPMNSYRNIAPAVTVFFSEGDSSTKITAIDLPTKTARPYYSIRSDIIPRASFIGGNQDLTKATSGAVNRPVVGIVNKVNGYGDFYSGQDNQTIFTNTEKRVITQIKTSVHDPDGSYSKVNNSSAVIYKIIKEKKIDLTPVQTLLESKKKQDQLEGQQGASMLKDLSNATPNYSQTFSFS